LAASDNVEIVVYETFSLFNSTFNGNVTINEDLTVDTNTLHVDSTNNRVGIGTASPEAQLDVSSTTPKIRFTDSNASTNAETTGVFEFYRGITQQGWFGFGASDSTLFSINNIVGGFRVYSNGSEALRINDSGNIGIGTSSNLNDQLTVGTSTDGFTASVNGAVSTIRLGAHDTSAATGRFDYDRATGLLTYKEGTYNSEGSALLAVTNSGAVGIGTSSPATALDVNGTVTADNLNISAATNVGSIVTLAGNADGNYPSNTFGSSIGYNFSAGGAEVDFWNAWTGASSDQGGFKFRKLTGASSSSELMFIKGNGNVGIGTSSVDQMLHVEKSSGTTIVKTEVASGSTVGFEIAKTGSTTQSWRIVDGATVNGVLEFYDLTNTATRMAINSSGNIGIGTASPLSKLNVKGTQGNWRIDPDSVSGEIQVLSTTPANDGFRTFRLRSNESIFETNGSERMRIDSSGQLMVGMSSSSGTANGLRVIPNDFLGFTTNASDAGDRLVLLNRQASDGTHIEFRKANSTVGSIGVASEYLYIHGTRSTDAGLMLGSQTVAPASSTGANRDNSIDLGFAGNSFKDLYLGGGVYVGGTGSANHLDDYEEGTFSFSWNGGGSVTTYYSRYVKIGRLVHINCDIQLPASSSTSTAVLSGLPFNHSDSYASLMAISYNNKSDTHLIFFENNNEVKVRTSMSGGRATCANMTAGRYIFSGSYYTTA
jgi:hypothetical protein